MITFDIPWWAWILIFLYIFVVYFGIGAVLGLVVTRLALSRSAHGRSKPRSARTGLYILAALGGGALNFFVTLLLEQTF